jgi:hypothetical protein
MKGRISAFGLIITLLALSYANVFGVTVQSVQSRVGTEWCWAASIECVTLFYGESHRQCDIVCDCCMGGSTYLYKPVDGGVPVAVLMIRAHNIILMTI